MSESKYPPPLTAPWWDLRNAWAATVAAEQKRRGVVWSAEDKAKAKRAEYFALHGRESDVDEAYAAHWNDR